MNVFLYVFNWCKEEGTIHIYASLNKHEETWKIKRKTATVFLVRMKELVTEICDMCYWNCAGETWGSRAKHTKRVCFPDFMRKKSQLFEFKKHQMLFYVFCIVLNSDMKNWNNQLLNWFDIFGISENGIINCFFVSEIGKLFFFYDASRSSGFVYFTNTVTKGVCGYT